MRTILAMSAAFLIFACGPKTTVPDQAASAVPARGANASAAPASDAPKSAEQAALSYDAVSKTAEAFTGALEVQQSAGDGKKSSPGMKILSANGNIYETNSVRNVHGADRVGITNWAALMVIPNDADVAFEQVASEQINPRAANGGFCAPDATSYLALAAYKQNGGVEMLKIAAFSDPTWPPQKTPKLCGVFTYKLSSAPSPQRPN